MARALLIVGIALLALASPVSTSAAEPAPDPALRKPVTLAVKGEALSDILKLLQNQTGVIFKAEDDIADRKLTIFVDAKPLGEVMRGITTLLQYEWKPDNASGYRVSEPEQVVSQRKKDRENVIAAAWAELESAATKRAALKVDAAELKAEVDKLASLVAEPEKLRSEHNAVTRDRDTPLGAAVSGDIIVARLYKRLTPEALAALKAGNRIRFDTQSPDPAWKLPPDVVEYLGQFVKIARIEEYAWSQPSSKAGQTSLPSYDDYSVALKEEVAPSWGVMLYAQVWPRYASGEGGEYRTARIDGMIANKVTPPQVPPRSKYAADDRSIGMDESEITITHEDVAKEAGTAKWKWDSQYDATPSDVLALLHRKSGLQIISDHYTNYWPGSRQLVNLRYQWDLLDFVALNRTWRFDGGYAYVRQGDDWVDPSGEIPNCVLRPWQAAYAKRGYLNMDELSAIAQLAPRQLSVLRRAAHLIGLESIDWHGGWTMFSRESPPLPEYHVRLYGLLSAAQRKEAFGAGTPVAGFSAQQKRVLDEIRSWPSPYGWREWKAIGRLGKVVVGIYDKEWKRVDQPDDPKDAETEDTESASEPVSLTIREKQGEKLFYRFPEQTRYWPSPPWVIQIENGQTDPLQIAKSRNPKATAASIKSIANLDYEFTIKLADGNEAKYVVSVPLAPVPYKPGDKLAPPKHQVD